MTIERPTPSSIVLAAGIAVAGMLLGLGFAKGRSTDRYVEVKGVAEREVKADLALWPLHLVAPGNDLVEAQARIVSNTAQVFAFLRRHGVDSTQVELQSPEVTDAFATPFGGQRPAPTRFIVTQTVMVRSPNVDVVLAASQRLGELVSAGVVLSSARFEFGPAGPTFLFTKLNDLKPAMIREATASARQAAEQFATDSRSRLGGIRQANQGVFVILPRDQAQGALQEAQRFKTVRVVTTVQYYLRG